MLNWPKTSRRLDQLVAQLGTMAEELASLRAALAGETERALAAEEKLLGQVSSTEELGQQLQHLRDRIDELTGSVGVANAEQRERLDQLRGPERLERLEQLNSEREADCRRAGLTLTKLEKRLDQQAEDATTTAALLLGRIEASR